MSSYILITYDDIISNFSSDVVNDVVHCEVFVLSDHIIQEILGGKKNGVLLGCNGSEQDDEEDRHSRRNFVRVTTLLSLYYLLLQVEKGDMLATIHFKNYFRVYVKILGVVSL